MGNCTNCDHPFEMHTEQFGCRRCTVCGDDLCDSQEHPNSDCGCTDFAGSKL